MALNRRSGIRAWAVVAVLTAAMFVSSAWPSPGSAAEPIKIGFGMALTGGLAANGKAALVAMQLWAEDVNKKGGLLGRPVEADYIRKTELDTIIGKVKWGPNGEGQTSQVLMVQFQGVETTDLEQFKHPRQRVVVDPDKWMSGNLVYPYSKAKPQ